MKFRNGLTMFIAAAFFVAITATGGFAADNEGNQDKNNDKGSQTETSSTHDSSHQGIESGRDFGQHVRDHNDMFSGDHNPGVHHQGYSGIKN